MTFSFKTINWAYVLVILAVSLAAAYIVALTIDEETTISTDEKGNTVTTTGKKFALWSMSDDEE